MNPGSSVVTVGTFDGIHRGHQAIFARVRELAAQTGLQPVLVTFHPHPRVVLSPNDVPMLLTSIEEKEKFIPNFFDGKVLVLEFDQHLMNLTAEEFVQQILVDVVGVKHLVVGYDHALGKDRRGDISELKRLGPQFGFSVEVVAPVQREDKPVSSSRIRKAMASGHFKEAIDLLGHEYAIGGTVERGIGLGRKLGYPTANVAYSLRKLLPPPGVYACWAELGDEEFCGMLFIGQNHFNPANRITVEANLFDFDRDIYDEEVIVYPMVFIRENRRYEDTALLVRQIEQDKQQIMHIVNKGERTCP
jgi:riboflavin kinase/FMN adenylyltransferase